MRVAQLYVQKGGYLYNCMRHYNVKQHEFRWKCGKCMRGIVHAWIGDTCAVCGASVADIRYEERDGNAGNHNLS